MKNKVWAAALACILLGSCASKSYYTRESRSEAKMKMDYQRQDRENYRQNKRMQKQAGRTNRQGYDTNEMGNVLR